MNCWCFTDISNKVAVVKGKSILIQQLCIANKKKGIQHDEKPPIQRKGQEHESYLAKGKDNMTKIY